VAIDEVAVAIALVRLHDRVVADDAALEHVVLTVELARLFAFRDLRSVAGRRLAPGDPRAARAQALRERALRSELDLELARDKLPLELLLLADVARDHLLDLTRREQHAEAELVDAAVVRNDGQVLHPALAQRCDAELRDAAQAESARDQRRAVRN